VKQLVSFVIDDEDKAEEFAKDLMANQVLGYINNDGDDIEVAVSRVSIGPAD
jgi:hypothetical protein